MRTEKEKERGKERRKEKKKKKGKKKRNDRVFAVWDGHERHMPCGHSCPRMLFNVSLPGTRVLIRRARAFLVPVAYERESRRCLESLVHVKY